MLLERIYDDNLAQASYLLGCQATGQALVLDPNRDIEQYIAAAAGAKLHITHVAETHIHADFASGSQELAARTGGQLLLSDCGDADWKYRFATAAGAQMLRDGDRFMVGNLRIDVMHTPGHTPEHIVFIVTDMPATDSPIGVFTGDFVFVGDVGRPDLLEKAAGITGTMEASARSLFASIQRFKQLPDHLQIWPGHGAGSACGKALGAMPNSTLGYERIANWALQQGDERAFVAEVLAGQPTPPRYFARMKRVNRDGVPPRGSGVPVDERSPADALEAMAAGATLLDLRRPAAFGAQHVAGAINVPHNRSFVNWAGAVLDYERDAWLVSDGPASAQLASRDLSMIGFDRIPGWVDAQPLIRGAPEVAVRRLRHVSVQDAAPAIEAGALTVVDVRNPAEWNAGHVPGAIHIPLGELANRLVEIPRDRPIVMHCQGGSRSAIAASLLDAEGMTDVANLTGGFGMWEKEGKPVERG